MVKSFSPKNCRSVVIEIALLVLIAALAYLPLVPQLGYYHDDWFTVASRVSGVSLSDMHYVDRPLMGKVYQITHALLGDRPLNWHLFAFAVRCWGALAFYATVRLVWPRQRLAAFAMAALFVVYPGFLLQPNANNYSNHLIALALGMTSLALSILALRAEPFGFLNPRLNGAVSNRIIKIVLIACAALLVLFYPRIYETMIGLEGLRWVLFGLILLREQVGRTSLSAGSGRANRINIRRMLLYGAPFLAAALVFLGWRFLFFNSVRQGTDAGLLLAQYSSQPLGMAARIVVETGKGYLETVLLAWAVPLYQSLTGLGTGDLVLAFVLAAVGAGVLVGYFRGQNSFSSGVNHTKVSQEDLTPQPPSLKGRGSRKELARILSFRRHPFLLGKGPGGRSSETSNKEGQAEGFESTSFADGREMALVGALSVLLMLLPVTLAGRGVEFSYNLNRYTLPAAAGVAILGVGLVVALVRPGLRIWPIAALLALAVAAQYSNAVYFRDFWAQQQQFWWQVSWRAPGLEPETVLAGMLPAGYRAAEDFEVWAPADLIYYPHPGMGVNDPIGVMASLLTPETVPQIRNAERVPRNFRQISYTRRLDKTLVFSMSAPDACVHLVDGSQVELPYNADPLVLQVAKYSRIREIKTDAEPAIPPDWMFGKEPAHVWCFYYQKAGLARQKGDWAEVARLGDEANRLSLAPNDASEWIPFYEAYERLGNQEGAAALASKIRADVLTWDLFCSQFPAAASPDPAITVLCQKSVSPLPTESENRLAP